MPHADHSSVLVTRALEQVVGLSLRHTSSRSLLATVVRVTRQVLPGDVEASVTLVSRDRPRTAASTGPLAAALDQAQYAAGDGPCLHSATAREVVLVPDTRSDDRWASFRARAVEHGTLSSLSVPLDVAPDVAGSLNVYAQQVGAFPADVRSAVTVLTASTASALGNVRDYQAVRSEARRLRAAMERDAVVDQAVGMLIERQDVAAADARRHLTELAARTGATVHAVAAQLVGTGRLPQG